MNLCAMLRKRLPALLIFAILISGCAMTQSIIKSTFTYTTDLSVSASAQPGKDYEASGVGTSFDQNFSKSGNNADRVNAVRIISARLRAISPTTFNIGNISEARFYMSKPDGSEEVMVASRTDITPDVGNSIVLDIDNSHFLDQLIRMPNVKIRMIYKLRNGISTDATLRLVLGLSAYPNN
jgi:hypothetical protein